MQYSIVIHKDADSNFGVSVPDVAGCFSAGASLSEAKSNAKQAIECHLEGMLIDGEVIPRPSGIEKHRQNKAFADGISWDTVDIDVANLSVEKTADVEFER